MDPGQIFMMPPYLHTDPGQSGGVRSEVAGLVAAMARRGALPPASILRWADRLLDVFCTLGAGGGADGGGGGLIDLGMGYPGSEDEDGGSDTASGKRGKDGGGGVYAAAAWAAGAVGSGASAVAGAVGSGASTVAGAVGYGASAVGSGAGALVGAVGSGAAGAARYVAAGSSWLGSAAVGMVWGTGSNGSLPQGEEEKHAASSDDGVLGMTVQSVMMPEDAAVEAQLGGAGGQGEAAPVGVMAVGVGGAGGEIPLAAPPAAAVAGLSPPPLSSGQEASLRPTTADPALIAASARALAGEMLPCTSPLRTPESDPRPCSPAEPGDGQGRLVPLILCPAPLPLTCVPHCSAELSRVMDKGVLSL